MRLIAAVLLTLLIGGLSLACGPSQPTEGAIQVGESSTITLPTTATSVVGVGESIEQWQKSPAQEIGLTDLPAEMPQGFWFGFRYSSGSTRYVEVRPRADGVVYEGTYVQSGVDGPALLTFSRDEMQDMYSRVRAVRFLRYPVVFGTAANSAASGGGYVLAIGYGEVEHSVSWYDDGQSQQADAVALRDLFGSIKDLVGQKLE